MCVVVGVILMNLLWYFARRLKQLDCQFCVGFCCDAQCSSAIFISRTWVDLAGR
jgi:hypothetical protein